MRSPLPFPCVPDRPYKILLVQVGTLSFSHPSFGVPVLFIGTCFCEAHFAAFAACPPLGFVNGRPYRVVAALVAAAELAASSNAEASVRKGWKFPPPAKAC